jgi:hypothetical protein
MGTYNYTDSQTGKTYTFEYGGDAPTNEDWGAMSQIINADRERINQMSMDVLGRPLTPEDDRMAFRRGLDIGATSAYGALGTAARSAGEGIGIDFLQRLGAGMEQSAREEQLREATQMPAPTRFADVEGVGDFLTFIGEGAGQTVPEMAATIGGGFLGGLAGATQGNPLSAGAGFIAGSTAVGTPLFFGRNIQRQEQQVEAGALPEVDRMNAFLTAGGQAVLNSVGDKILATGRLLGINIPPSPNLFVRAGQFGAAGAIVEVPTEITQQIMERAQAGLPLDSEDAIAEYIEAGILGGVIGAGVGGGLGAFRGPEAPPAPPGATPPAAGPTPATPPVPPVPPVTPPAPATPPVPPVPPVTPPAPATVVNTRIVTVGGGPAMLVTLSNGQVLALPSRATQADIDAAVAQYNSAQKQIIPPAGPSVPPTQAPPAVPPVATQPTPGLTAQEEADVETELQTGTPVEQTQALLRSLLGPRLRPNMYKKLENLGVGPDDPVVLNELEAYLPVYQRNQKLMDVDPGLPARLRRHIDETRARQAAEAASGQTQATAPTQGAQPAPSVETQPTASPEFVLEPAEPSGGGVSVPRDTPLTEAEAFEAAAELAAQTRAAQPGPVGGAVAPTPAAPSGAAAQPGALGGRPKQVDLIRSLTTGQEAQLDRYDPETGQPRGTHRVYFLDLEDNIAYFAFDDGSGFGVDITDPDFEDGAYRFSPIQKTPTAAPTAAPTAPMGAPSGTTPAAPVIPRYNALRAAGLTDEQIRGMSPEQREAALDTAQPTTFDAAAVEQSTPPAGSVALDPAYTEEAAAQIIRFAAIRAGIPQTPELLAEAADILRSKGGDPVAILSDLYMPFDAPSDPSLAGRDPFGAEEETTAAAEMSPETALRIRRQLREAQIYPIDFVPLESQAKLEQTYDQERVRFEQQYAIRPDQRGMPYLRTPVDQWTGYDWYQAKQDMREQIAPLEAAFIARERGRAPMVDKSNNLAYELRQAAPELEEQIATDPVAVMEAALANTGIPEIEPMFRPQQGKDPFGAAEDARSMAAEARRLPAGAQVLAQGQVTPAGIIPRPPTFTEPDADLTEAERALGAAFERAVVPGPDVAPAVGPTQEEIAALEAADRTLRTAWEARNPNLTEEMRAFIFPEDAIADPSTVEDRQTVRGLFLKGQKGEAGSAATIFGKYPTVVQGLDHIAELQSRDKNLTRLINNEATEGEVLVNPEKGPLDYGNALDFFEQGIVGNTSANASKWVKANLSPEANLYLKSRIAKLRAAEKAIRKRTSKHDPVAIARKEIDRQIADTERQYQEDFGQVATAQMTGISRATRDAAMNVAENSKTPFTPELPTNVTATEQELAAARTGMRLPPSRMRGWTGLEIAVAQNFEGITTRKQAQAKIDELSDADIAQMIEDRAVTNQFLGLFRRFKTVRQAAILDVPVPFMVRAALMNNNLKASILHIARTAADAEIRAIARTITANLANTNVQLVDPADPANRLETRAYGAYDPETDTVLLPNTGDITIQTLLHEAGHAVTAAYIENNPNSAEVGALKKLFSTAYTQVMPYMSSVAYREGGVTPTPEEVTLTEVKEFVGEIKSNMELRNALRRLALNDLRVPQKGALLNALEWVNSVFRKIMRKLARSGPQPSLLAFADFVVDQIMTPQRAAGDVLFSRGSRPGTGVSPLMAVVRPLRDTAMNPSTRQKFADDATTFMDSANTIGTRTLLGFLPPLDRKSVV